MGTKRSTRYLQGKSNEGASDAGSTELARAVLCRAIKDMHGDGRPHRKDRMRATVFLASNRAALWLDVAGIEQTSMLLALRWEVYAQAVLDDPPKPGAISQRGRANGPERRVLEQGIVALTKRRGEG